MATYNDVVRNPRIPRENAGSQANNQNKRRVYNKSQTNKKKTTNTRKSNPPQPPFSFNLFLGNMGGNGMPQILADRALLGLMNAQNIPNGVQNPVNPLPAQPPQVPPPGGGHILGGGPGGFREDDRRQLEDVVDIQQMLFEEQQNIRNAINNNAFNQERQNQLRDELLANQNNNRQFLELLTNQTQASLRDISANTLDTQMNGLRSRQLIETVNNRTIELENQINTSRQEHNQSMKQMKTMFNMMLTPGSDKKKLNDAYNERRDELRNDPQGFLDVIFENKDLGAPRQSPQNPDLEAGAREEKSPSPSIYHTPKTSKKPHVVPSRLLSKDKRLDMAAGGRESSDDEIQGILPQMDGSIIDNVENEMMFQFSNNKNGKKGNTESIPRTPVSMFVDDSDESDHEDDDDLLEEDANIAMLENQLNELKREDAELNMLGDDLKNSVKKNRNERNEEAVAVADEDLIGEDLMDAFNKIELGDNTDPVPPSIQGGTRRSTRNINPPDRFRPSNPQSVRPRIWR